MRRIVVIALKDLRVSLRDRTATISMLAVPLALSLVLGTAFGSFGGSHSGLQVLVVDQDGTAAGGQAIAAALAAPELASLLAATPQADLATARRSVDQGQAVAVIIPAGTGAAVTGAAGATVTVDVYANPTQPIGAGIVRSVVDGILARINAASTAGRVTALTLVSSGTLAPGDAGLQSAAQAAATAALHATDVPISSAGAPVGNATVDYGKIIGPSFAILFLMFTTTAGARRILEEREAGTLARLLVSPSRRLEILAGKGVGIYLVGAVQMALLLGATTLIFGISWGSIPALVVLTAALVFGATAWGLLLAGIARTPVQANQAGTALTIVFGITAGNFVPRAMLPQVLQSASLVTPNGLGLEGYGRLVSGDGLAAVAPVIAALLGTGIVLIVIALVASQRRLGAA